MADYYKLSGSKNPTTDWTAEVILERNDEGEVSKVVGATRPAQLNSGDLDKLKDRGYEVTKVSKDEAEEAVQQAAAPEALGAAPLIGSGTNPGESKPDTKNDKK